MFLVLTVKNRKCQNHFYAIYIWVWRKKKKKRERENYFTKIQKIFIKLRALTGDCKVTLKTLLIIRTR